MCRLIYYIINVLFHWVVGVELLKTLFEVGELVTLNEGHASTDTLLVATGDIEGYRTDTVADKLVEQVNTFIAGVAEGEIESVADVFTHVFVVDDEETVVGKHLFHNLCLLAVFLDVLDKVESAVVGSFEHGRHGVLHRVGCAGTEAV